MRALIVGLVAALLTTPGAATAQNDSRMERAELSPSGERVAFVATVAGERRIRVQTLDGAVLSASNVTGVDLRDIAWAGESHVLMTVARGNLGFDDEAGPGLSVLAYDVDRGAWETLLRDKNDFGGSEISIGVWDAIFSGSGSLGGSGNAPSLRPDHPRILPIIAQRPWVRTTPSGPEVLISTLSLGSCQFDLYRADLDIGAARLRDEGSETTDALAVNDGVLVARLDGGRLWLTDRVGWYRPRAEAAQGQVELLGRGQRPGSVLIRTGSGDDAHLLEVWGARGSEVEEVDTSGLSEASPIHDDHSGALMGFVGKDVDGRRAYHFLDTRLASLWQGVLGAFRDEEVTPASWSADFSRLLIFAEGADGAQYHLVNSADRTAITLADSLPTAAGGIDRTGLTATKDILLAGYDAFRRSREICRASAGQNLTR